MHIQIKSALAVATGLLVLMMPATVHSPVRIPSLISGQALGDEAEDKGLRLHRHADGTGRLYGFSYRGF